MLKMCGKLIQSSFKITLHYLLDNKKRTTYLGISALVIFVTFSLYYKHALETKLHETSTFRLEDFAEKLDPELWDDVGFQYQFNEKKGRAFEADPIIIHQLGIPLKSFVSPKSVTDWEDFVFLTGASEGFHNGLIKMIESLQKFFPDKNVLVYDLGLSSDSRQKVSDFKMVQLKTFDFENFPAHVKHLNTYAFKPIIVHETLRIYPGLFWVDSSVRMTSSNMSAAFQQLPLTGGILLQRNTGHSNFAVTHAQMYQYLPTSEYEMKKTEQREANSFLVYRTREVYTKIIKWWTLCALQQKCISPTLVRGCRIKAWDVYALCHRFDQSALNILLANMFHFNDRKYVIDHIYEFLTIERLYA